MRDAKSLEIVALADVDVAGRKTQSNKYGMYEVDDLPPGRYTLQARFAGQPITIQNIEVTAGMATYVDVLFTLGEPSPLVIDWGDPREGEIKHLSFSFAPPGVLSP